MDTTLEDRKVTTLHVIAYGFVSTLIPIIAALLHVYGGNLISSDANNAFTNEYMREMGFIIFQGLGFLVFMGTAFWIARKSRVRTLQNSFGMLITAAVTLGLFAWIMGLSFNVYFIWTLLTWAIGVVLGSLTPRILKGKRTHREDWDARKDKEYHEKKRK